jgi:hypothetical protein
MFWMGFARAGKHTSPQADDSFFVSLFHSIDLTSYHVSWMMAQQKDFFG